MNIRITHLEMTNFKCFQHKELSFDALITTIKGRNGVGKTTIADAIFWTLFGKNSQGQADFDLKTHDENGVTIPHLDHSVEMTIAVDTKTVTIKRTLKETWVKKRGSDEQVFKNNTTEFLVNGDSYTAGDYKKYISELISEDVFKMITNPNYFPSLKWQDQRDALMKMVGEISPTQIANTEELSKLAEQLADNKEDIIAYRKHLSYQIKQLKDKLDKIPVRLEELNKALPEVYDWVALTNDIESKNAEVEMVKEQITAIKQGDGSEVQRAAIKEEIKSLQKQIDYRVSECELSASSAASAHRKAVSELSVKFNEAINDQRLMENTIEADKRLIERIGETDYEAELQKLREQWPSSKFKFDPALAVCPTCGQPIPDEQLQEKIKQMRTNFNLQREAKIKELNTKASQIKQQQKDSDEEKKNLEAKLENDKLALENIKDEINEIFAEKSKAEKTPVPSATELLSVCKPYNDDVAKMAELKEKLDNTTTSEEDNQKITELEASVSLKNAELRNLQEQLANKAQYERIQGLMSDVEDERRKYISQLSELERSQDLACMYEDRQNLLLEEKINEHFKVVKWKLFQTINNGGEPENKPWCECFVDGSAYHNGLNQAARLNAGLDIINTMCEMYGVSAPIVLDNAEAVNNILETKSQQIRLYVSLDELQIV